MDIVINKQSGFAPIVLLLLVVVGGMGSYIVAKDVVPALKSRSASQMTATPEATESSTPAVTSTPTPTSAPTPTPTPSCIKVKTSGMFTNDSEFAGDKCYTRADANLLDNAIESYNKAIFNYNGAASQANVTCQGFTESFKQMCEESKKNADKYKAEVDRYSAEIKAIMARGK